MKLAGRRGMVLIFALWVLSILTILAVSMASGIRQKMFLAGRLDERSRMSDLLLSSVKKTAGYIHQELEMSGGILTPAVKGNFMNNSGELINISLGHDRAGVGYLPLDSTDLHWGVIDEESKLNLNKANLPALSALLVSVLALNDEDAVKLATALLDWRQYGESEIIGFSSEDYYQNLQYPFQKKSADYETLDELLLVRGVTKKIYNKLINYVTIYGSGAVNVNTASKEVLEAIGLPESVVDKIIQVRQGRDSIDGTIDDHVYSRTFEITSDINAVLPLTLQEASAIDSANARGLLTTTSYYYTIQAVGKLANRSTTNTVKAVYSARDDKIVYWKERGL